MLIPLGPLYGGEDFLRAFAFGVFLDAPSFGGGGGAVYS